MDALQASPQRLDDLEPVLQGMSCQNLKLHDYRTSLTAHITDFLLLQDTKLLTINDKGCLATFDLVTGTP